MLARLYLALTGLLYLALGIWCAIAIDETSRTVGFTLQPGSGESEFLTVYGGLEVALGLIFLRPLLRRDDTEHALWSCVILHTGLVVFRTIGFLRFDQIGGTTWSLATGEWIILLAGLGILWSGAARSAQRD